MDTSPSLRVLAVAWKLLLSVLCVGLLLSCFVLTELIMRARNPRYISLISVDNINYHHTYSDTYGWKMQRNRLLGDTIANRKGYRGKEYEHARQPGQRRVLMLGDSLAFGYRQEVEETFSYLLDTRHDDIQVINMAVQGYGTDQALIKLEREGLDYSPDMVLLHFCLDNDFRDNSSSKFIYDGVYPKPFFTCEDGELVKHDAHLKLPFFRRWAFVLANKSILYNELLEIRKATGAEYKRNLIRKNVTTAIDYDLTFRLIKEMDDLARNRGAALMVLVHPNLQVYKARGSNELDLFFSSAILRGVRLVNMYEKYTEQGFVESTYGKYAIDRVRHLSAAGHELTARIVYDLLSERD